MTVPGTPDPSTPEEPPRPRRGSNLLFYAGAVLIVAGFVFVIWLFVGPERYREGDCFNYVPARFDFNPEFEVVGCSDPAARSVILKILDDPATGDEKRICEPLPGYVGHVSVQRGDTHKVLCLAKK